MPKMFFGGRTKTKSTKKRQTGGFWKRKCGEKLRPKVKTPLKKKDFLTNGTKDSKERKGPRKRKHIPGRKSHHRCGRLVKGPGVGWGFKPPPSRVSRQKRQWWIKQEGPKQNDENGQVGKKTIPYRFPGKAAQKKPDCHLRETRLWGQKYERRRYEDPPPDSRTWGG